MTMKLQSVNSTQLSSFKTISDASRREKKNLKEMGKLMETKSHFKLVSELCMKLDQSLREQFLEI